MDPFDSLLNVLNATVQHHGSAAGSFHNSQRRFALGARLLSSSLPRRANSRPDLGTKHFPNGLDHLRGAGVIQLDGLEDQFLVIGGHIELGYNLPGVCDDDLGCDHHDPAMPRVGRHVVVLAGVCRLA